MKPYSLLFALALLVAPLAQAQVHFDSGSAVPRDAHAGTRHVVRAVERRTAGPGKVRCRDGSRHLPRVCRRHGGIAG